MGTPLFIGGLVPLIRVARGTIYDSQKSKKISTTMIVADLRVVNTWANNCRSKSSVTSSRRTVASTTYLIRHVTVFFGCFAFESVVSIHVLRLVISPIDVHELGI